MPPRKDLNKGQSENKAANALQAFDLRTRGLSYARIGKALGVSGVTAYRWVAEQLDKINAELREKAEHLQAIEMERLDDAITRVTGSDAYRAGDPASINVYIRLSESRRKLLGLDAPERKDVTSGGERVNFNVILPSEEPE